MSDRVMIPTGMVVHLPGQDNTHLRLAGADAARFYAQKMGFRNGLPTFSSISEITIPWTRSTKEDIKMRGLLVNSALQEIVLEIQSFVGSRKRGAMLATSRNAVSGEVDQVSDLTALVRRALCESLEKQAQNSELATVSPLNRKTLWIANYVWECTQKFCSDDWARKRQTIDAIPLEKGGQTQRVWWNDILPSQPEQ